MKSVAHAVSVLRGSAQKLAVSGLILLAAVLLVLGKVDLRLAQTITHSIGDGWMPVMAILVPPINAVKTVSRQVGHMLALADENARLRAENRSLRAWQARAVQLEVRNRFLSELAAMPLDEALERAVTARVVADSASTFVQSRLLDAGRDHGLANGMAAIDARGLVGRLVEVGEQSARLLLLTDYSSRIPVIVQSSGDKAILSGDNGPEPWLRFLPLDPSFRVGDNVLTSGEGGVIPPGLPIGRISSIDAGAARVRPHADWARLELVTIVTTPPIAAPDALAALAPAFGGKP